VGYFKPPMLVFDGIAKCTYGSEDIEVVEAGNQVVVKALKEGFEETNLYVKVGSKFFVFIVKYEDNPKKMLYNYQKSALTSNEGTSTRTVTDVKSEEQITKAKAKVDSISLLHQLNCQKINSKRQEIFDIAEAKSNMMFLVSNMYVKDNHFYIKMGIQNESEIDYKIQFIRFEIRNTQKRLKASSDQQIVIDPVYVHDQDSNVQGKSVSTPIFVFEEFILDKNRKIHVEIWEKEGDRILSFDISYKEILKLKEL
jgi:conjugative transposon TraN protein